MRAIILLCRHKTFKADAKRGKSSTGWFYSFKLHLLIDDCCGILSFCITRGNVDDIAVVAGLVAYFYQDKRTRLTSIFINTFPPLT